jgi:hypothetical protein
MCLLRSTRNFSIIYIRPLRFPSSGYDGVKFENVYLWIPHRGRLGPIGNATISSNNGISCGFADFHDLVGGYQSAAADDYGPNTNVSLEFTMTDQHMNVQYLETNSLGVTVTTTPTTINHGASTLLNWRPRTRAIASATGAWSGSVGSSGSRAVKLATAGYYNFGLSCQNAADALATTQHVSVQ